MPLRTASVLSPPGSATEVLRTQEGILKRARAGSPEGRRLEREGGILARAGGVEGVPRLLSRGADADWTWLLLEDVGGRDLDALWAEAPPCREDVVDVGLAVGRALAGLHALGILHRDVKEGNIVRGDDGHIFLVDLGIAREMGGRRRVTVDGRGTPGRMAPETVAAERLVGPEGDVYSLALVLVEALTCAPTSAWPRRRDAQLRACGLDPRANRDRRLVALLDRALRIAAWRRPSAASFVRELDAASRDGSRWPWRLARRAGLALLLSGIGIAVVAERTRPPLAFEDASPLLPVATGFRGPPTLLADGSVYVPRGGRVWSSGSRAASQRGDLLLADGAYVAAPVEDAGDDVQWVEALDVDGDGVDDLLVDQVPAAGGERHVLRLGPAPWRRPPAGSYPDTVEGRPVPVPADDGGPPRVLLAGVNPPRQLVWSGGAHAFADAGYSAGNALQWADVDEDGRFEVLVGGADLSLVGRGGTRTITGGPVLPASVQAPGRSVAAGDVDADGDEDLVWLGPDGLHAALDVGATFEGRALPMILDPSAYGGTAPQLVDLDADGRAEVLLPSGGFADRGAGPSRVWRLGADLAAEELPLPASLARAQDGARLLARDVDGDGVPDLLGLSINDRLLDVPDDRLWRTVLRRGGRYRTAPVTAPGGGPLPYGTRLRATSTQWVRVVRDRGPVTVPEAVDGELLVFLPGGEVAVADAAGGPIRRVPLPALVAADGQPLDGREVVAPREAAFHVRAAGHVVAGWADGGIRIDQGEVPTGRLVAGAGFAADGRYVAVEHQPEGGFRALLVDAASATVTRGAAIGMADAVGIDGGPLWVSRGGRLGSVDPRGGELRFDERAPKVTCRALAVRGEQVGCCTDDGLLAFDTVTLEVEARWSFDGGATCAAVPLADGWIASTPRGAVRLDPSGVHPLDLGEPLTPSLAGAAVLLLGTHMALWLDMEEGSWLGGTVVAGMAAARPRSEPWERSASR